MVILEQMNLGTLVFEVFIYFYNLLNNIVELWRWKKTLKKYTGIFSNEIRTRRNAVKIFEVLTVNYN